MKINRDKLNSGIEKCLQNVEELLGIVQDNVGKYHNDSIFLGLYSYAIEEYGKALWLKESLNQKKESYEINPKIFGGYGSHEEKITRACGILARECYEANFGIRITNSISQPTVFKDKNHMISRPNGSTGTFEDVSSSPFKLDFEFRKDCFFIDWDRNSVDWKVRPSIVKPDINEIISKFREKIKETRMEIDSQK